MCKDESQAELKPFKVGEPSACKDGGNPEPSVEEDSKACVETRRRVCKRCKSQIPAEKYSSAKYCSIKCRQRDSDDRHRVKTGKTKKFGVGSGGNQWGENNHRYTGKSGDGGCIRAMRELPNICNRCGKLDNLVAHHIDEDRSNNNLSNFEILCKKCHQEHHAKRDAFGRYTKG